ncbi:hypothetical protein ABZ379_47780 [Streptomyces canus]|uniref:hypothetical protein n=1 Tax=Streptomyces canus TaxID=58343 RepID=UPI0033E8E7DF
MDEVGAWRDEDTREAGLRGRIGGPRHSDSVDLGQWDQPEIAGASVNEGGDGGLAANAHDEVAFPVAETLAQLDDRWPVVDQDGGRDIPACGGQGGDAFSSAAVRCGACASES